MTDAPVQISGFAELTLETRDLAACERFYRDLLSLPLLARDADRVWLAAGDRARLGLWCPGTKEFGDRGGRHVHFALSAPAATLDAIHARLRRHGWPVQGPVTHEGGDRSIYLEDPAGNMVELWDFFHDGAGARDGVRALDR